jgi:hypothetical protein
MQHQAASTVRLHATRKTDASKLTARSQRDVGPKADTRRVFDANFQVYEMRKVWSQLQCKDIEAAHRTVAPWMREMAQ